MMLTTDCLTITQEFLNGQKVKAPEIWFGKKEFQNLTEARKFENLLKRQKGGTGFYRLT